MKIAYVSIRGIDIVDTITNETSSLVFNHFREYCKSLGVQWTHWVQQTVDNITADDIVLLS